MALLPRFRNENRACRRTRIGAIVLLALAGLAAARAEDVPRAFLIEWPQTDFSKRAVALSEIVSGGPPRDGIPAIDNPVFINIGKVTGLAETEPVLSLYLNGEARAYPIRILIYHEIVNDTVGGVPVAVTYCPLCNSGVAFERRVEGRTLDFGTTGKLRHSDLVMYDRQTESWWQQFMGEAIVGAYTGTKLNRLPLRHESLSLFRARAEERGKVLVPNDAGARPYGANPYEGYDTAPEPFLYTGKMPEGVPPLARVVAVDGEAWTLDLVRRRGTVTVGGLVIRWTPGQTSPLDSRRIAEGRDIGNVTVERRVGGVLVDVPYDLPFAFAFHAFYPGAPIHTE